jgi:hypothetical protein
VLCGIAVSLFGNQRQWIVCATCGQTIIALNNYAAIPARTQISGVINRHPSQAEWFRSSAITRQAKYDILAYWTPTLIAYTSLVISLAVLAGVGLAYDWMVYAVAVAVVNLFVFSYSQATRQGPILRGNLSQYMVVGENLRKITSL